MPFVALDSNQNKIAPPEALPGERYECPECEDNLGVRREHTRDGHFVCRHFWHPAGAEECVGESAEHQRMKSVAWSKARDRWPSADVGFEQSVGDRRADVLVRFDSIDSRLGEGVAIECQYRNEQKDVQNTQSDFLENGFSVLWLNDSAFDEMDVDFQDGKWVVWWAHEVPDTSEWEGRTKYLSELKQEFCNNSVMVDVPLIGLTEAPYRVLFYKDWMGGKSTHSKKHQQQRNTGRYGSPTVGEANTVYRCMSCGGQRWLPEHPQTGPRTVRMGCPDCAEIVTYRMYGA